MRLQHFYHFQRKKQEWVSSQGPADKSQAEEELGGENLFGTSNQKLRVWPHSLCQQIREDRQMASFQELTVKVKIRGQRQRWILETSPVCRYYTISTQFVRFISLLCHEICTLFHKLQSLEAPPGPGGKRDVWFSCHVEGCVSKSLVSGLLSRGKDKEHTCASRCHADPLFSRSQAKAGSYQSFPEVCLCKARIFKGWTFKPAFNMRPGSGREGKIHLAIPCRYQPKDQLNCKYSCGPHLASKQPGGPKL